MPSGLGGDGVTDGRRRSKCPHHFFKKKKKHGEITIHDERGRYMNIYFDLFNLSIQLTLVISTSLISNNRLSRSENLVPAYT